MPTLIVDGHTVAVSIRPKGGGDDTLYVDFYRPDGRRCRWSTTTTDETDALRAYEAMTPAIVQAVREGATNAPPERKDNPRLSEITDYYTKTYLPNKHAAPKTVAKSVQVLREWELWCAERRIGRLQQLSRAVVDGHAADLRERKQAPKSIAVRLGILRACLNAAVEGGLCDGHPIKKWLMPTVDEPEIAPLTLDELAAVLKAVQEHYPQSYNAIAWMAYTGNRPSDTVDLRWRQVDRAARVVSRAQVKTSRLASYEIADAAAALVEAEAKRRKPGADAFVFTNRHGEPFSVKKLYRDFINAASTLEGFPAGVNLKTLRHSFGHTMVNVVRCPLPTVQALMGHTLIETTMKYVRPGIAHDDLNRFIALLSPNKKPAKPPKKTTE